MRASIIAVGTELLFGQIVNTNAAYLSRELQTLGIDVLYHYTVGDNADRMRDMLRRALEETDLVIASGGLGPTQDDMTKEIIAEVMGARLAPDERALSEIESFFKKIGRDMTDNNRKQAMLPEGAAVFYNARGTAPGFAIASASGGGTVIALPGPPSELVAMFESSVIPYLGERADAAIYHRMLRFYGIGESQLETDLSGLIDGQTDPTFATYAKEGECSLRIASKRRTREEAEAAVEKAERDVLAIAGDYMYSDSDEELSAVTARLLLESGLTLSSAESCTGGLFASALTSYPGISEVFDRGYITYSNEAKSGELGVPASLIESHGAVSEEVAAAMAEGCREAAGTDIGVSVTGVAGPGGGTEAKPVGLAWIAIADADGVAARRLLSRNKGRDVNRRVAVLAMLNMLRKYLVRKGG
ncbi:MAG: competence/damage-inducible protein A [Clostridiales Family XIII bacterium]|jgi:nicotinamide-nucleotide amidase|nr:competence/damage-inducible protein A [Clostridiales Family XIII bacterium]